MVTQNTWYAGSGDDLHTFESKLPQHARVTADSD